MKKKKNCTAFESFIAFRTLHPSWVYNQKKRKEKQRQNGKRKEKMNKKEEKTKEEEMKKK